MAVTRYTDASLALLASEEATILRDALGALKEAIRPLLDEAPYYEHADIRLAFNCAATEIAKADEKRRERFLHA